MTEIEATKKAEELLAKMTTKGWRIRVWENLGWHYGITNGWIYITPYFDDGTWCVMVNRTGEDTCDSYPYATRMNTGNDPNVAVLQRLQEIKTWNEEIKRAIAKAVSSLEPKP
jgi:hypothetical protein